MNENTINDIRIVVMIFGFLSIGIRKYRLSRRIQANTKGTPTSLGMAMILDFRGIAFVFFALVLSYAFSLAQRHDVLWVGFWSRQIAGLIPFVALIVGWKRTNRFAHEAERAINELADAQ